MMTPKAKRNGKYGYRAQIEFDDGRPSVTIQKRVFPSKWQAEEEARKWIKEHEHDPAYNTTYVPPGDPPTSALR